MPLVLQRLVNGQTGARALECLHEMTHPRPIDSASLQFLEWHPSWGP